MTETYLIKFKLVFSLSLYFINSTYKHVPIHQLNKNVENKTRE